MENKKPPLMDYTQAKAWDFVEKFLLYIFVF